MQPTPEFLASPEVTRFRQEKASGSISVAVESYATKKKPSGVSVVYISVDGGKTFASVDWRLSWFDRIRLLLQGRNWPPDHCRLSRVDKAEIELSYMEHMDASRAEVFVVRYSVRDAIWRI